MGDIKQLAGELERVMRDARVPSGEGFTTAELAEAMGCSQATAQRRVKAWFKAGLLLPVRATRENIAGIVKPVPAYVPVTSAAGPSPLAGVPSASIAVQRRRAGKRTK